MNVLLYIYQSLTLSIHVIFIFMRVTNHSEISISILNSECISAHSFETMREMGPKYDAVGVERHMQTFSRDSVTLAL